MSSDDAPLESLTAFMVVLTKDGGLDVYTSTIPTVTMERHANLVDLEAASMRLAAESGRLLLAQSLRPEPAKTASDVVSEALAKRSGE